MGNFTLASTIVTGGTAGFTSVEMLTGSLQSFSDEARSTTIYGGSTTLTSVVASYLDNKDAQTAQAVSYIETCSDEEIDDLVEQIDLLLAQNGQTVEEKGYTRTLKNKNFS